MFASEVRRVRALRRRCWSSRCGPGCRRRGRRARAGCSSANDAIMTPLVHQVQRRREVRARAGCPAPRRARSALDERGGVVDPLLHERDHSCAHLALVHRGGGLAGATHAVRSRTSSKKTRDTGAPDTRRGRWAGRSDQRRRSLRRPRAMTRSISASAPRPWTGSRSRTSDGRCLRPWPGRRPRCRRATAPRAVARAVVENGQLTVVAGRAGGAAAPRPARGWLTVVTCTILYTVSSFSTHR